MSTTYSRRIRTFIALAFALTAVFAAAQSAQAETFTPPNTPALAKTGEVDSIGALRTFYDATNNVIHVLGTTTLTTYDADTLEVKTSSTLSSGETFWQYGNAFDPTHSAIFVSHTPGSLNDNGEVSAITYDPVNVQYSNADTHMPTARTVLFNSTLNRLYAIATQENGFSAATVAAADIDEVGIWSARPAYSNINLGDSSSLVAIQATTAGTLVGSFYLIINGFGMDQTLTRRPIYSFADTGDALEPTAIPGTQVLPATVPPSEVDSLGYFPFTPRTDGSIAAIDSNSSAASRSMLTLDPSADASGFTVDTDDTLSVPFVPSASSFDTNGDLYFSHDDTLSLFRDGEEFASKDTGGHLSGISGGEGAVYAISDEDAPSTLSRWTFGGYSPTITTTPAAQSVTLTFPTETAQITLHSGGSGTPTPTVRWQKLSYGAADFTDIPGATSADLTTDVVAADNGASYRAIYSNAAGEIATASAQLTVTVNAPQEGRHTDDTVPAPAAPKGANGKSVKLKYKKGKPARVAVGTITCASVTTCVYTLPTSIKFKIGTKSYKAKVVGPKTLEPGKSETVYATVPDGAIKKLKGKKSKLVVPVQVANTAGKLHSTTMSIISKIRA